MVLVIEDRDRSHVAVQDEGWLGVTGCQAVVMGELGSCGGGKPSFARISTAAAPPSEIASMVLCPHVSPQARRSLVVAAVSRAFSPAIDRVSAEIMKETSCVTIRGHRVVLRIILESLRAATRATVALCMSGMYGWSDRTAVSNWPSAWLYGLTNSR
jgi:hypothetical protein